MKKQITIAALALGAFVLGINNVQAQSVSTEPTTVNIELSQLLSIETSGSGINFRYTTANDYSTDQKQDGGSIKVTSTTQFDISVQAADPKFLYNGSQVDIPVSILEIRKKSEGDIEMGGVFTPNFKLTSAEGNNLISGVAKGIGKTVNIEYLISSDDAQEHLFGQTARTYTQTITYTATAR